MMKKSLWFLFAFLCLAIGLYPILYFFIGNDDGLLSSKSPSLLADPIWRLGFYAHIFLGGIALLLGWTQFSKKWRSKHLGVHRNLGKIYVLSALASGMAGFGIGFAATGGPVAKIGFISLAIIWFSTTFAAFLKVKKGDIAGHEKFMVFSYAACFAAVTLRLWLPFLVWLHEGDFVPAYRIVAWLCWVPNLAVAFWLTRKG